MDLVVLTLDELEAERLVPADREDVERDLAPDGETQVQLSELSPESLDKGFADSSSPVILLELVTLRLGAVATDWAHVDHAIAEFDKGAALDRDVEVRDVVQDEVYQLFEIVFSEVLVDALFLYFDAELVSVEPILSEAPISCIGHLEGHLLTHLDEVAARHDAKIDSFSSHLLEGVEHLLGDSLAGRGQSHVDIEKCDDTLLLVCHYFN